jgi:hypothetical protein
MYSKNPIPAPHKGTVYRDLFRIVRAWTLKMTVALQFACFCTFLEDVLYTVADPSPLVSILQRIHHRETV